MALTPTDRGHFTVESRMAKAVELHPVVATLSQSFVVQDGLLFMSADDAQRHLQTIQAVRLQDRDLVATHLVALAFRFKTQAGEAATGAIALLVTYTIALIGEQNLEKAADLFGAAGMGKEVTEIIGTVKPQTAPRMDDKPKPLHVKARRGLKKT